MTGMQLLRIVAFLLLPVASALAVLAGRRRSVAATGWKGRAVVYGPVLGATTSLAVFVVVVVVSVLAGH